MNITTPLTGAAQTGFTSPTYTLATDVAPYQNGKQWLITAKGGTQPDVTVNSVSRPFSLAFFRPPSLKVLTAALMGTAGMIMNPPKNSFKLITRKGVTVNLVGGSAVMVVTTTFDVPVGAELQDGGADIKAAISAHLGALSQDTTQWFTAIESGAL